MSLQGVDGTLTVLEVLARLRIAPLTEISREAVIPKSRTHRVLQSLVARGYAEQEPETGRYRPGLGVLNLVSAGLESIDLRRAALPALRGLASATGETVHLVVLDGDVVVYVDKVESTHAVRMASRIGIRGRLHSTACGKAILARLSDADVRALVEPGRLERRTPNTIADIDALLRHLAKVRASGYAIDDEENESEVRCIGMAIIDPHGRPAGAVSISAPAYRLPDERVAGIAPLLSDAVAEIARMCNMQAAGDTSRT